MQTLLQELARQDGHRLAHPGEFTRRAFENGKLDLTGSRSRRRFDRRRNGIPAHSGDGTTRRLFGTFVRTWKIRLSHILALMEADLDFSDQDLPDDILLQTRPDVADIADEIASHLNDNRRGERLRNGYRLAILGAPNAGKSSLLNMLSQRDAAIVSPVAGTTRDVVETHLDIGGYPVILSDTAGLRDNTTDDDHGLIEAEGIRRSVQHAADADIKILVFDGTMAPDETTLRLKDENSILLHNKSDMDGFVSHADYIGISAKTGAGMEQLVQQILTRLKTLAGPKDKPVLTRARHRDALQKAHDALVRFEGAPMPELAAEDLRLAVRQLGVLTGRVDVEDLLDMIFRDFCIGK